MQDESETGQKRAFWAVSSNLEFDIPKEEPVNSVLSIISYNGSTYTSTHIEHILDILEQLELLVAEQKSAEVYTAHTTNDIDPLRWLKGDPECYRIYGDQEGKLAKKAIVVTDWRLRYGRPLYDKRVAETYLWRMLIMDYGFEVFVPTDEGLVLAESNVELLDLLDEMVPVSDQEALLAVSALANKHKHEVMVLSCNTFSPFIQKFYEINNNKNFRRAHNYHSNRPHHRDVRANANHDGRANRILDAFF